MSKNQKLQIEITDVTLLKRKCMTDLLILSSKQPKLLTRVVGAKRAKEVWQNELCFRIETTAGCGEKLAEELGLEIDDTVKV